MLSFIGRRLLASIPVVFAVSVVVFLMVDMVPGDAAVAIAGENASPQYVEQLRQDLGLDDGIVERYVDWISGAIRFDFGESLFSSSSVLDLILARLPATMSLALAALVIALLAGTIGGILAGRNPGGFADRAVSFGASLGAAMPNYFIAAITVLFLAVTWRVFPATGYVPLTESPLEWLHHLVLPAIALAAAPAAVVARQLRQAVVLERHANYARTARAKGLSDNEVVFRHVLRNASLPAVSVLGVQFVFLLGGTAVVEAVFGIPGLGLLVLNSVLDRDFPVIQGIAFLTTLIVIVTNIVVDLLYGWINPQLRVADR